MIRQPKAGFCRRLCRIGNFVGQRAVQQIGVTGRRICQRPVIWPRQKKHPAVHHGLFLTDAGNAGVVLLEGLHYWPIVGTQVNMTIAFDGGPLAHFFIASCCHEMSAKRRITIDMGHHVHINQ